jgi:uncharacterized delta-60 repeat protein
MSQGFSRVSSSSKNPGFCTIEPLESRNLFAADLVVSALHVTPGTVLRSDGIHIFGSVTNIGDATFPASARTLRLFLSTSSTNGAGTDYGLGRLSLGDIAPGQVATFDRITDVPSNAPAGSYYITALADPDNAVAENSETNNTRGTRNPTVRVSDQAVPTLDQVALDKRFGTQNGRASALLASQRIVTDATLVDPQGRILVAGSKTDDGSNVLLRFLPTGALDTNFGTGGVVVSSLLGSNFRRPIALTHDGKILYIGTASAPDDQNRNTYQFGITRYTDAGLPDDTFTPGGTRTYDIRSLINANNFQQVPLTVPPAGTSAQTGDLLPLGGTANIEPAYLKSRGKLPPEAPKNLADSGPVYSVAGSVDVDSKGKIYMVGSVRIDGNDDFAVLRLNADGTPDTSFAGTGATAVDYFVSNSSVGSSLSDIAVSLSITRDGGVVVVGPSTEDASGNGGMSILKLTPTGKLDTRFARVGALFSGPAGPLTTLHDVRVDPRGKIIVAGSLTVGDIDSPDFGGPTYIARYLPSGALDSSFGTHGSTTLSVPGYRQNTARALFINPRGKILIDSLVATDVSDVFNDRSGLAILRLNANGKIDRTFGNRGANVLYSPPIKNASAAPSSLRSLLSSNSSGLTDSFLPSGTLVESAPEALAADTATDFQRTGQAIAAFVPNGDILAIAASTSSTDTLVMVAAIIPDGPDLSASISTISGRLVAGEPLTASVKVANLGSLPARGPVTVVVFEAASPSTLLGQISQTISLANGLLTTLRVPFFFAPSTPAGTYTLLAKVTPNSDAIPDVNPADDTGDGKTITLAARAPNVAVSNVAATGTNLSARVTANGNTASIGSATLRFYASNDQIIDPNTNTLIAEVPLTLSLAIGKTLVVRGTASAFSQSFVGAILIPGSDLSDADPTDNISPR